MSEVRLYYKIKDISNEWSEFYYYNGTYNNSRNQLEPYTIKIKNEYYNDLLELIEYNKDKLLYYMNEIEYSNLMDNFKRYKNHDYDIPTDEKDVVMHLKNNIINTIRLKVEFKAWFKYNGFHLPNS